MSFDAVAVDVVQIQVEPTHYELAIVLIEMMIPSWRAHLLFVIITSAISARTAVQITFVAPTYLATAYYANKYQGTWSRSGGRTCAAPTPATSGLVALNARETPEWEP